MADNAINAHGGKILVKGLNAERHKGGLKGIVMMITICYFEDTKAFYISDEYQPKKVVLYQCSNTDLMLIKGFE